jgi:hypothetical protein
VKHLGAVDVGAAGSLVIRHSPRSSRHLRSATQRALSAVLATVPTDATLGTSGRAPPRRRDERRAAWIRGFNSMNGMKY